MEKNENDKPFEEIRGEINEEFKKMKSLIEQVGDDNHSLTPKHTEKIPLMTSEEIQNMTFEEKEARALKILAELKDLIKENKALRLENSKLKKQLKEKEVIE